MTLQVWVAFALLVTVLSLTPGPAVLLVLSQALSRGMGRTAWTILGIIAANTLYFALSATGLGAVLIASHTLFSAIRWIGAGYLTLIGAVELFSGSATHALKPADGARDKTAMFAKGFVLQISSPAAILFFAAVIPQFLNLKASLLPQAALLALTGNAAEFAVLFFYAGIADRFAKLVVHGRFLSVIRRISGLLLMAAGAGMAFLNS